MLACLISFNVYSLLHASLAYTNELFTVFSRPYSWPAHIALAQALRAHGSDAQAKNELSLAVDLYTPPVKGDTQVLGVSTTPLDLLSDWESAPARDSRTLHDWQQIVSTHPDYRDAYVQMAEISYTQGNLKQTKAYLASAAALDPNGKAVTDILRFISKRLE